MILIPAIDLRGGRCVRLRQGRADAETVFGEDPVAIAEHWARSGAERLHVVDLDGAFAGAPRQTGLVARIIAAVRPLPVEAGGGLRDVAAVSELLSAGARWAVVGTRAALDPAFLEAVCAAHPDRVIVAADARGTRVAVKGWVETSAETVPSLALRAARAGAAALLYTDIERDGTGLGPNVAATAEVVRSARLPVLASGGVGRMDDVRALAAVGGVAGVVLGRALYTGAIDLAAASAALGAAA